MTVAPTPVVISASKSNLLTTTAWVLELSPLITDPNGNSLGALTLSCSKSPLQASTTPDNSLNLPLVIVSPIKKSLVFKEISKIGKWISGMALPAVPPWVAPGTSPLSSTSNKLYSIYAPDPPSCGRTAVTGKRV